MKFGYGNYTVQQVAEERCLYAELMERAARERAGNAAPHAGSVAVEAVAELIPGPRQPESAALEVEVEVH